MNPLLLLTFFACGAPSNADAPGEPADAIEAPGAKRADIDVAELKKRLGEGSTVLIDVRTVKEFATGHVPGAKNVPLRELDPAAYKSGPVYVICASGGRSSSATDRLVATGIDAVNITGGTKAWRGAGYEVE